MKRSLSALALVFLLALSGCTGPANEGLPSGAPVTLPPSPTSTVLSKSTPYPIATPTSTPTWTEVVRWEGQSIKETETFTIHSNEWRILWDTRPGEYGAMNFQIYIYAASGDLKGLAANIIGQGEDVSYVRGRGDYYLTINTAQPYVVVIQDRK